MVIKRTAQDIKYNKLKNLFIKLKKESADADLSVRDFVKQEVGKLKDAVPKG